MIKLDACLSEFTQEAAVISCSQRITLPLPILSRWGPGIAPSTLI